MRVEPLSPLGARVTGLRIKDLSRESFEVLVEPLLLRYGLLVFDRQEGTSPEDLLRFALLHPDSDPSAATYNPFSKDDPSCLPGFPMVRALGTKTRAVDGKPHAAARGATPEENRVGYEWHTNGTGITCLMCCEAPRDGSRTTMFASGYEAYDCIGPELQDLATTLDGRFGPKFSLEDSMAEMWRRGYRVSADGVMRIADVPPERLSAAELEMRANTPNKRRWAAYQGPIAKRHPETRRLSVFTVPTLLECFEGRGDEESMQLMGAMIRPGVGVGKVYTHRWQAGDVALWDNRCMLHSTTPFCERPHLLLQVFARTRAQMLPAAAPFEEVHSTFVRVWVLSLLVRTWTQLAGSPLVALVWLIALCAAAVPAQPLALGLALVLRLGLVVSGLPNQYDSQLWALLCDSACAVHLGALMYARLADRATRPPSGPSGRPDRAHATLHRLLCRRLSSSEQRRWVGRVARTNLAQLGLCYSAAGFWKLNSAFLDPHTSCAPVFFAGLLTQVLPPSVDRHLSAPLRLLSPLLTISVELLIGGTLLTIAHMRSCSHRQVALRRLGVVLIVTFHLLIALTPPPNDIASYGVSVLPRIFLMRPYAICAALRRFSTSSTSTSSQRGRGLSAGGCVLAAALAALIQWHSITLALVVYASAAFVCYWAALLRPCAEEEEARTAAARRHQLQASPAGRVHMGMLCLAFAYAFVGLALGVMDMGSAHMFSNLRAHGGSNHLIAPTGLLQRWLHHSAGVYGGGVVRVEATDSEWLLDVLQYPGEVTSMHSARARALMQGGGHTGRHWHPMLFSTPSGRQHAHGEFGAPTANRSHRRRVSSARFTLPSFELRRRLAEMRAYGAPFSLTYTQLPGVGGDEAWRAHASGRTVIIRETPQGGLKGGRRQCRVAGGGRCLPSDLALLPAPSGWLYWPGKLLLSVPYVVIDDEAPTELHCYSP